MRQSMPTSPNGQVTLSPVARALRCLALAILGVDLLGTPPANAQSGPQDQSQAARSDRGATDQGYWTAGKGHLDFPLAPPGVQGGSHPVLSFGSVGLDSRAAGSDRPARGDDQYHFMIPSQEPPKKAPGFLFRIPLGQ